MEEMFYEIGRWLKKNLINSKHRRFACCDDIPMVLRAFIASGVEEVSVNECATGDVIGFHIRATKTEGGIAKKWDYYYNFPSMESDTEWKTIEEDPFL
tara:strand:- start:1792 stop:2085 length:294 start_codon:yes stop_codon:yes gene_type:complete